MSDPAERQRIAEARTALVGSAHAYDQGWHDGVAAERERCVQIVERMKQAVRQWQWPEAEAVAAACVGIVADIKESSNAEERDLRAPTERRDERLFRWREGMMRMRYSMADAILSAFEAVPNLPPDLPDDHPTPLLVRFRLGDLRALKRSIEEVDQITPRALDGEKGMMKMRLAAAIRKGR